MVNPSAIPNQGLLGQNPLLPPQQNPPQQEDIVMENVQNPQANLPSFETVCSSMRIGNMRTLSLRLLVNVGFQKKY